MEEGLTGALPVGLKGVLELVSFYQDLGYRAIVTIWEHTMESVVGEAVGKGALRNHGR
jgi:hypothetical protein